MNQHEILKLVSTLNATFRFVGLSADFIDEAWYLGDHDEWSQPRCGPFIVFFCDAAEQHFKLIERTYGVEDGEDHDDQLDTFIEGDFRRLMDFIETKTTNIKEMK